MFHDKVRRCTQSTLLSVFPCHYSRMTFCSSLHLKVDAAVKAAKEAVENGQSSVVMEVRESYCTSCNQSIINSCVGAEGWIGGRARLRILCLGLGCVPAAQR